MICDYVITFRPALVAEYLPWWLTIPDVKYVRLGYIGTCNMEHISHPPSAFPWVSQSQVFEIINLQAAREELNILKGMQQNQTAIYLGVGEPITTRCFHACCGNKSKDIKSQLLP